MLSTMFLFLHANTYDLQQRFTEILLQNIRYWLDYAYALILLDINGKLINLRVQIYILDLDAVGPTQNFLPSYVKLL